MRNFYAISWLWLVILAGTSTAVFQKQLSDPVSPLACNVTVNAGNDQTLCNPGQVVNLSAVVTGNYLSAAWSPRTGIADTSLLATNARVDSTITYRMTVRSLNDQNLISNSNFDAGNIGFTSDYTHDNQDIRQEGKYAVVRRPRDVRNSFTNCSDHTGGGFMMVVNASGDSSNVWCQTITVQPNTEYLFGAWAASMVSENPARLQFSINNILIGNVFTASAQTCNWQQFTANWRSNTASTAQICIANVNNTPRGNDFAIDDLSFRQICETTDEVTINVVDLNAEFTLRDTICQSEPAIALNTLLTPATTPNGTWTIDGTAATTLDPAQLTPGTHRIRYTAQVANCEETSERTIVITTPANAGMVLATPEVCAQTDTTIRLADLIQNEDAGGIWTEISMVASTSGAFNAANGTFRTANQAAGIYQFNYKVDSPGTCPDAEVTVNVQIKTTPTANAGNDLELNCQIDMVTIGGASAQNNFTYQWTASSGSPIVNADLPMTEVEQPDTYTLIVTDLTTGCSDRDTVTVTSNITKPSASLEIKQLTCNQTRGGAIRVNASGAGPFTYALDNGNFSAKNEFQSLEPGNYFITVRDNNGCDTTLQATLEQPEALNAQIQSKLNGDPPTLPIGTSTELNLLLSKPLESITSIVWTPDSIGCNSCTSVVVSPTSSTTYSVRVTDINGCSVNASLLLFVQQTQRIYVPTAFSPNGDGVNDTFYINAGEEITKLIELRIFNRWGNLVYNVTNVTPNDPSFGWDGTFDGHRPVNGVYIYYAELERADGQTIVLKGEITLIH
ncbi:MAG: gliding motility-associated C-terminal domain-containing protein [Saprospiraceae bacterium]